VRNLDTHVPCQAIGAVFQINLNIVAANSGPEQTYVSRSSSEAAVCLPVSSRRVYPCSSVAGTCSAGRRAACCFLSIVGASRPLHATLTSKYARDHRVQIVGRARLAHERRTIHGCSRAVPMAFVGERTYHDDGDADGGTHPAQRIARFPSRRLWRCR
jgi:hypothetical protein